MATRVYHSGEEILSNDNVSKALSGMVETEWVIITYSN